MDTTVPRNGPGSANPLQSTAPASDGGVSVSGTVSSIRSSPPTTARRHSVHESTQLTLQALVSSKERLVNMEKLHLICGTARQLLTLQAVTRQHRFLASAAVAALAAETAAPAGLSSAFSPRVC
jgi:hypothetical protein